MLSYDRYTELLSKRINRTIMDSEHTDIATFEATQPKTCPRCRATVHSYFMPGEISHDVENFAGKITES